MEILVKVVLLVVGFVMLIKGADWFVEGASKVADKFGIPQLVIGLTIVAFGTSAPEFAVSVKSLLVGNGCFHLEIRAHWYAKIPGLLHVVLVAFGSKLHGVVKSFDRYILDSRSVFGDQ